MYARAKAPTRAGHQVIQWGLIAIPVGVFTGQESGASVPRKMFTADGHAVGSKSYDKETGADLSADQIVKRAQAGDGTWVELTDEEIEQATTGGPTKGVAEILFRAPRSVLGTDYLVEKVDQVRAGKRLQGTKRVDDPNAQKALALLLGVLAEADEVAIVRIAGRTGAKTVAITPEGGWLTLAYAESIREALPMPEVAISDAEWALARQLLATIPAEKPELTDDTGAKVQAFVDAKAGGVTFTELPEAETAPVIDLMAALAASISAAA